MTLEAVTPLEINEVDRALLRADKERSMVVTVRADVLRRIIAITNGDPPEIKRLQDELDDAEADVEDLRDEVRDLKRDLADAEDELYKLKKSEK